MAKVKYRIREFKPTANQTGGHSVYAEAVVDNIITNKELAKVATRAAVRLAGSWRDRERSTTGYNLTAYRTIFCESGCNCCRGCTHNFLNTNYTN